MPAKVSDSISSASAFGPIYAEMHAAEAGVRDPPVKIEAPIRAEAKRMADVRRAWRGSLPNHHQAFRPVHSGASAVSGREQSAIQSGWMASAGFFDWGTHWFDMFFHNDEKRPLSILAQVEPAVEAPYSVSV